MEKTEWLDGWKLHKIISPKLPYNLHGDQCCLMQEAGEKLFGLGALPDYTGLNLPEIHRLGSSGNFAIRLPNKPKRFLVTRRDAHKGYLTQDDFSLVFEVDWDSRLVYVNTALGTQPSTDSLLVAKTFEIDDKVMAWAHFHEAVDTEFAVKINYPALGKKDWDALGRMVEKGVRIINMIDHDLLRKGGVADGKPDAAIIIGEDPRETFKLAIKLAQKAFLDKNSVSNLA